MPVILLTRPDKAARRFAEALRSALGEVEVIVSPLMEIHVEGTLPEGAATPIFTSRNGVLAYAGRGGVTQGPCWCVGDATAQEAERLGLSPRSSRGDADALVETILKSGEEGPFLHIRGKHARGDVAARLRDAGRAASEVALYDQVARPLSDPAQAALRGGKPLVLPLFSPRTAELFISETAGKPRNAPVFIAAMSEAVAKAAAPVQPERMRIAARPDADAMMAAVRDAYAAAQALEGAAGAT